MGRRDHKFKYAVGIAAVAVIASATAGVLIYTSKPQPAPIVSAASVGKIESPVELQAPPKPAPIPPSGYAIGGAPLLPSVIFAEHPTKLPELQAWAADWEKTHIDQENGPKTSDQDAAKLQSLVEKSDLSAWECMQVAELVGPRNDLPVLEAWMNGSMPRVIAEVGTKDPDDTSVNPILDSMGNAMRPLWDDGPKNGVLLEKMNDLNLHFTRNGPWSQRMEWSRVGHGEALYLQGRYEEALAEAKTMLIDMDKPTSQFRPDQRATVHYLCYNALVSLKRFDEALPQAELAAIPEFHHARDAYEALFYGYMRAGRNDDAKRLHGTYTKMYGNDVRTRQMSADLSAQIASNDAMREAQ